MAENSAIEWTTHTFNPWVGCTKISPGCDHCYAEGWAKRSGMVTWGADRRRTSAANWRKPLKWSAAATDAGPRPRVFCASLADVFDNEVPQEWRDDLFKLILQTQRLDWLLLTKRIGNVEKMLPSTWQRQLPSNVWLGISVVNQEEADRDIPKLLRVPAAVRFLSCEPLLGPIDLSCIPWGPDRNVVDDVSDGFDALRYMSGPHLDWVIVGGESGAHARPMLEQWAHDIRGQCKLARIAFFMKQGSQANWPRFKDFESFPPLLQKREWPRSAEPQPETHAAGQDGK